MTWQELFSRRNSQGYLKVREKLKELGFKKTFKIFHVVGTNGKGSLSQYLNDSFIASGKKVGMFTSPHIFKPNERIKINNNKISNKAFFKILKNWDFSFFETLYIVAMLYFQKHNIDIAIIEAGIGGNQDTTKAVAGDYGTITSIGLDHEEILGNSLEAIAQDKSGIINSKMKFYIPTSLDKKMQNYFKKEDYKIVDNYGSNYKKENARLAKGILEDFHITPIIKQVPYRTEIIKKNNRIMIADVAHNEAGIKASLKYLQDQNIEFDRVVITINKKKWKPSIKKLFQNKEVLFYQHNKDFYFEENNVEDLTKDFNTIKTNTLYIGTFQTIELLKNKKSKEVLHRFLFGVNNTTKINIFMMIIAAFFTGMSIILGSFVQLKFGPIEIKIDYIFYILFGLLFGFLYGSFFAVLSDTLISLITGQIGLWMWQYAIIPIMITLIASCIKVFIWESKKWWLLFIIIAFAFTDILALSTFVINNYYSTYQFKNNHQWIMIIMYICFAVFIVIQILLIALFLTWKSQQVLIRKLINIIIIVITTLLIVSILWGPFAFIGYVNKLGSSHFTLDQKYIYYLIPRIIKFIPESLVWTAIIFSIEEVITLSINKINSNRW